MGYNMSHGGEVLVSSELFSLLFGVCVIKSLYILYGADSEETATLVALCLGSRATNEPVIMPPHGKAIVVGSWVKSEYSRPLPIVF